MAEKTYKDVEKYAKQVANKREWILDPSRDETYEILVDGLKDYFNRIGYFNCPCRDSNEDRTMDRDIICPCDYAQADIEEYGRCYCALFYDPKYDFTTPLEMIPERRPDEEW